MRESANASLYRLNRRNLGQRSQHEHEGKERELAQVLRRYLDPKPRRRPMTSVSLEAVQHVPLFTIGTIGKSSRSPAYSASIASRSSSTRAQSATLFL